MKALITTTIEYKALHTFVVDFRGQFTEILVTTKFCGIPIFRSRKYFSLPLEESNKGIPPISLNTLPHQ